MKKTGFLVVDDSPTIRDLVRRSLKSIFGSEAVYLAENGRAAMQILRQEAINIIISDWEMPEMNGEELLCEVRSNSDLKGIPFIMMSNNAGRDFIITAIQLGVNQYIVKPFSADELEKKVRASMSMANRRREQRYCLPEHVMNYRVGNKSFSGKLLDLSRTGAAFTGVKFDPCIGLFRMCEIELQLLDQESSGRNISLISGLFGRIVRLEAENTFHPTSQEYRVALYFHPGAMETDVERRLNKLIKWLASNTPDIIAEN